MIDHKTVSMLASSSHIPSTFPYHLSKKTLIPLQYSSVSHLSQKSNHLFSRFFSKCSNLTFSPRFSTDQRVTNGTSKVKALREQLPSEDQKKTPPVPASESKAEKAAAAAGDEIPKHHGILWFLVHEKWYFYGLMWFFRWFPYGFDMVVWMFLCDFSLRIMGNMMTNELK